jgi:hypothetical protein
VVDVKETRNMGWLDDIIRRVARERVPKLKYGPFRHVLNKGGLDTIVHTKTLKATHAAMVAGGGSAVRAHDSTSTLEIEGSTDRPVLVFTTDKAPRQNTAPNGIALWSDDIDIHIHRVLDGTDGKEADIT